MQLQGELFWNICDFWELESPQTGPHSDHNPPGRAGHPLARPGVLCPPRKSVGSLLHTQEYNLWKTNCVKISTQSELRISGKFINSEGPDLGMRNKRE